MPETVGKFLDRLDQYGLFEFLAHHGLHIDPDAPTR
jgi:hypothetical protein